MRKVTQILSMLLCLALCLSLLPAAALAEENSGDFSTAAAETEAAQYNTPAGAEPEAEENSSEEDSNAAPEVTDFTECDVEIVEEAVTEETVIANDDSGQDDEDLFAEYVNNVFYGTNEIMLLSTDTAGDHLTGQNKIIYDYLKPLIKQVADGEVSSTVFSMPVKDLLGDTYFYAKDLGVETIDASNAGSLFSGLFNYQINAIVSALVADCSYELYWYDRVKSDTRVTGTSIARSGKAGYTSKYIHFDDAYSIVITMAVAGDFAAEPTETETIDADGKLPRRTEADLTKTGAAMEAAANARTIVGVATAYPDYEKLDYYREKICDLTSYNYDAADEKNEVDYGNPWQLIWVFDNNPDTKVVCEGYSKAFKYLCEMSVFESSEINCITVTGTMYYTGGSGPHMWNIVHMDDGNNYLVDVTNCDSDSDAADLRRLFMRPASSGSVSGGYGIESTKGISYTYIYDDTQIYDESEKTGVYYEKDLALSYTIYHSWLSWETSQDALTRTRICRLCDETQTCLIGDCNGDGLVNLQDLLVLKKYLADGPSTATVIRTETASLDDDNQVNLKDLLLLRERLTGSVSA